MANEETGFATREASIAAALEALRVGRPLRVEEICRAYLDRSPGCIEHLRLLGHALGRQERYADAEQTIRLAIGLRPDFPHLHEDLGSVLALQRRYAEAVPSFEQAIRLEPRLPLAHKKLGEALAALGRGRDADQAFEEYFELAPAQGKVAVAMDHLRAGRKDDAVDTLRTALREDPKNVDAMRCLGGIYWRAEKLGDAEALLRRATQIAPDFTAAWMMLGALLHDAARHGDSAACFQAVISREPDNAAAWNGLASSHANTGDFKASVEAYARALALTPDAPNANMGLGHVLKTLGNQAGALRAYRAAITAKPDYGEVYWSMANLKIFRFEDSEVAAMEKALELPDLSESSGIHLRFALGKAHEDRGNFDRAWNYYETGNRRQRPRVFHDPVAMEVRHEEIVRVFSREFIQKHAGGGHESGAPIFIVGLPRSGSTLIEQILASHSQVEGTEELPTLNRLAYQIGRFRPDRLEYPLAVSTLRAKDFGAYGKQYIEETSPYRRTGRPRFTDKLPNNFSHVGLSHLILPNATVIDARRHPFDSCLGSYRQLFGKGQNFTYDMADLAVYYRNYHDVMQHWDRVLPGKVLCVHYEEAVTDLETQVRRILAHCGLPFEEACLRFHETQRPVRTASSEQVRQPLYSSSLGYWRRYEKYLDVWKEQLADLIDALPDAVRNAGL